MNPFKKILSIGLRKLGYELKTIPTPDPLNQVVTLKPNGPVKGNVLLAYIIVPFLDNASITKSSHTHYWESFQIAKTYLDMGYRVDVIDYRNDDFKPNIPYSLFVSARTNFQKLAHRLTKDCIKVVHLDTAHWMFNNSAAYHRYLGLQKRRGVTVHAKKILEQTWAIENADYAALIGNAVTESTYKYAAKPIFCLPVPTCRTYPWPENKDFDKCRTNFMWVGSSGVVNKGLDLVLEAFAQLPHLKLFVCGTFEEEKLFEKIYEHELYGLPNIESVGWVDVASDHFIELTQQSVALIYPSCAEGQAGAVATCVQAGLIPIVSKESGFDVHDFGFLLKECTINEITEFVTNVSTMPPNKIAEMSRKSWKYARLHHSHKAYEEAYKQFANTILSANRI